MNDKKDLTALGAAIAKGMMQKSENPLVYIASPFFDDASKQWVTAKEEEYDGMGVPYYSPRQDGINFNALKGALRSERIVSIFKNNVRKLNICEYINVNLTPCNGRLDIGTLWELGYFISKNGVINYEKSEYSSLAVDQSLRGLIIDACRNAIKIPKSASAKKPLLLHKGNSPAMIEDSISLANLDYEVVELSSALTNVPTINFDRKVVFLIDELPLQVFLMMGVLYQRGLPYYTASFKNHGSNVMIAASSRGHIRLPGLTDDTFNENLQ